MIAWVCMWYLCVQAIYLHHVIQTVEDILPSLLGLDAHLHFMLCWSLENGNNFC